MIFSLAPMEGLTGYIIRNAFHHHFDYIDRYYTPFIPAAKRMNFKIKADINPDNNVGIKLVPQAMSILADEIIDLHNQLLPYGYDEININLGCPSGTVVSKGRGSGILADADKLDRFLDDVFTKIEFPISIKTRIGFKDENLWPKLIDVYAKYPIKDLIIHPRIQKDFYKNTPRLDAFEVAVEKIDTSQTRLCYNGDITDLESFTTIKERFPSIDHFMIGRGLFMNPALIADIKGIEIPKDELRQRIRAWHDEILEGYLAIFSGEKDAMFRMKEIWMYLYQSFPEDEKLWKKIKKCQSLEQYRAIVNSVF